jgi:hypothetical protein
LASRKSVQEVACFAVVVVLAIKEFLEDYATPKLISNLLLLLLRGSADDLRLPHCSKSLALRITTTFRMPAIAARPSLVTPTMDG